MSENEYKKLRRQVQYLTVALIVFVLLVAASIIHSWIDPKATSFPQIEIIKGSQGPKGDTPQVDYAALDTYIQQQVASLPLPQNGRSIQGPAGPQGTSGQNVTPQQIADAVTAYFQANPPVVGPQGEQGLPGNNAPVLEIRVNPLTCQLQSKYDISDGWITIAQLPKPCEAQ